MKKYLILAILVGLASVLVPVGMNLKYGEKKNGPQAPGVTEERLPEELGDKISVYMADSEEVREMDLREYLVGVVAAEMPAMYETEALKAQAVISGTLSRYMMLRGPREDLKGAVISSDYRRHQGYMTVEKMRERWGEDFDAYYVKICAAVDETLPFTVTYEDAPILAVFHAISAGTTETAENVWGKAYPYLIHTDSEGDKLSPEFESVETFSTAEFFELLELEAPEEPENAVSEETYSDAGYLLSVNVAGKDFKGSEIRTLLSLRSSAITISYDDETFTLTVKGYGHGVGMSQYGADYLARQGDTWREIVAHYYPGTEVREEE